MSDYLDVPFNAAYVAGGELDYIRDAIENTRLAGNGPYCEWCAGWLQERTGAARVLLTHSGTAALEMAALLAGIGPGDEVIMPSFTFTSTANAVVLRGGVPVFVDIRPDTLNIDEERVPAAITSRTRAVFPVHYAGVGAEMDVLSAIASEAGLVLVEDAAQGLLSTYRDKPLGSFGPFAALSFHETKNIICGEGGALLVNDPHMVERAEMVHEKGTDRGRFFRGEVDKYTWQDTGSSFLLGELGAGFLRAQLEAADRIQALRRATWDSYHRAFEPYEAAGLLRRPVVPDACEHNAHIYYLLLGSGEERDLLIRGLAERGVSAVFHYVPLHSSPAGRRFGRVVGDLQATDNVSERLLRLPLWAGMESRHVEHVISSVASVLDRART
ncbi:MAG TPA: dTDP-4-amino-4,6-dideoxygalactose transaminase [Gaiellaceae bacterium]|nr:dTDP-4-amino-4,6-dideoxygalactose transaminase [Gaiellaceae bacterium]